MKTALFDLFGLPVTSYALLLVLFFLTGTAALVFLLRHQKLRGALAYAGIAAVLALALGRGIYCAIHASSIFYDPMGRSLGLAPLFDLRLGSFSGMGVVLGCLAAGFITAWLMHISTAQLLDSLSIPLIACFAAARFIEPLSGQGFGPAVSSPLLTWAPLSIQNGWGGWAVSVCFLEGLLLLAIALVLLRLPLHKAGSRMLLALLLVSASQLIPESLRRDDALKIFTFARVNQIGFAALFFAGCVWCWRRSAAGCRKGIALEVTAVLVGIVLLIACEFALDKTSWPDGLIYLGMAILLLGMLWPVLHRTLCSDKQSAN